MHDSPYPSARRRVLAIYNPVAGRRHRGRFETVIEFLRAANCIVTVRETLARGDAEALSRDAHERDFDVVLAAGGDGTINEVVNGLGPDAPPLALCPLGTANVLAAEIALDGSPAAVVASVLGGPVREVAAGVANGRRFLMMAGVGFDAHVVANVQADLKRRFGKGAYVIESLRQIWRFRFPRYRIAVDGVVHEAASAIIAKGHFYAGRFVCAPEARLDDPRFQVCLFRWSGAPAVMYYGTAMALGLVPRLPGVRLVTGTRIEVGGPKGDPVQGDGDTLAYLPLTAEIAPDRLRLLMPAGQTLA